MNLGICLKSVDSPQIVKIIWGQQAVSEKQIQEILSSGTCLLERGSFENFIHLFHSLAAVGTETGMD